MLGHRFTRGMLAAVLVVVVLAAGATALAVPDPAPKPNAAEQYQIEVLNRTRANPAAEAARFGISLNEGLPPGTLGTEAREPLAVNFELSASARDHNADLFAHFTQLPSDHRGSDGRDPTQRAIDAGVSFTQGVAENNAWKSQSTTAISAASVDGLHTLLFKDFTATFEVVGRGHRKVMLNGDRDEVGVAVTGGVFGGKTAAIVTQDFVTTARLHILGVAYADEVTNNDFYTPGEGLGGVTVRAVDTSSAAETVTTTWASGGYQIELPPGTYDVTASGGGLPAPQTVTGVVVTDANVKVDFVTDHKVPVPPPPKFTLAKTVATRSGAIKWKLAEVKGKLLIGRFSMPTDEADQLSVVMDGAVYFPPADRGVSKVTRRKDPKTGEVTRLTIKDKRGSTLTFDVRTGAFSLVFPKPTGINPTDGSVTFSVLTPAFEAFLDAPTKAIGSNGKQMKLLAATGTVDL